MSGTGRAKQRRIETVGADVLRDWLAKLAHKLAKRALRKSRLWLARSMFWTGVEDRLLGDDQ